MEKGTRVLIRTNGAGVHYGKLIARNGQEVHLKSARRIWSWNGALSLSEIAVSGVDLKNSKLSVEIDEIILPTAIEIIKIHAGSNLP